MLQHPLFISYVYKPSSISYLSEALQLFILIMNGPQAQGGQQNSKHIIINQLQQRVHCQE